MRKNKSNPLSRKVKMVFNIFKQLVSAPEMSARGILTMTTIAADRRSRASAFPEVKLCDILGTEEYPMVYKYEGAPGNVRQFTEIGSVLISGLAQKATNCNYLEISLGGGESLISVAPYTKNSISIYLSKEELVKKGLSEYADLQDAFKSIQVRDTVQLIESDFKNISQKVFESKFDLIFINIGVKGYDIAKITKEVFPLLRDEDSKIVWNGYIYREGIQEEVLNGIKNGILKEMHKHLYGVEYSQCAVFSRQNYPTHEMAPPWRRRTRVYEVTVVEHEISELEQ